MKNFERWILSWEWSGCYFIRDFGEGRLCGNEAAWRSGENSRVDTSFSYKFSNISSHGYLISRVILKLFHSRIFLRPVLSISSIQFHRTQLPFVKLLVILPGYHEIIIDLIVKLLRESPISFDIDMCDRDFCSRNLLEIVCAICSETRGVLFQLYQD